MIKYIPKVKEVMIFKEIALNLKNPCEFIREAISNCYDADSKNIWISINRNKDGELEIVIRDDGIGMDLKGIHSFFNLGDSQKSKGSIGEKGLGTKTYFKSKKIIVNTKKSGGMGFRAIMDVPWEKLMKNQVPEYTIEENELVLQGTEVKIIGYIVENEEKYFNYVSLKDYILWFTAAGNFKNLFADKLTLQNRVKNMNKSCKIYINDKINNKKGEMTGVHQFSPPNENPQIDNYNNKYKRSVNYCRIFGPYHRETTINGQYISVQLYGTVSGMNCRKNICKLRQSETYKSRFGLYLCKDFTPFEKANDLLKDEEFYHYHLLANSQNFVLTADRNNLSNSESIEVRWIFQQIEYIFKNMIKPIAEKEYFQMRKKEEEEYEALCRVLSLNRYMKKLDLVDNLYIDEIPIKKVPQGEYEVVLLFVSILSNEQTKFMIPDIKSIISYSSRMTTDLICIDYSGKQILLEVEYNLSNIFKHKHPINTYDYVVCWKIDLQTNRIQEVNSVKAILINENEKKYILTENNKRIKILELSGLINKHIKRKIDKTK